MSNYEKFDVNLGINFYKATMFIGTILYLFYTIDKFAYDTILGKMKKADRSVAIIEFI